MLKRGMNTPNCTQRTNSSGSGEGPVKPPTSWPVLETPESARPSPIFKLYFRVSQLVELSPDQVWTYRCMPTPPERETRKGRLSGACSFCASREARIIKRVCSGLHLRAGRGWPKTYARALPVQISNSLLSFHVAVIP